MGAQQFMDYQAGADAREAFDAAVSQALYDYGHRGYTGTIAEKDQFTVVRKTAMSKDDAVAVARKMLDEEDPAIDDKWGPAGAIPVGETGTTAGWLFFGWASS